MNGTRARKIRRSVYGDMAFHENRGYTLLGSNLGKAYTKIKQFFWPKLSGPHVLKTGGQVVCTGLRGRYKAAKKAYKRSRIHFLSGGVQ